MCAKGNLLVVVTTCLIAFATSYSPVARSESQREYPIDIARQPLTPAIRDFAIQTGLHVGYFPESPADENVLVGPVDGSLTADAALLRLLHPSGFVYEWLDERSIYVSKQQVRSKASKVDERHAAHLTESGETSRRWPGDRKPFDVDSMLVIGTRLTSLETESRSIAVLSQQQIESYSVSTLAELFGQLPQVPLMKFDAFRRSGEQYADLRGFGTGTTLVLINGRRAYGTATSFDSGGFDINTIPLTAIRRIEVVLDVPSVATGTDASGGVINIVLKDEIPEPTLELRYGAAAGGSEERRASFGIGASGERARGALTLDVFDRSQLLGMERDITRDQDYRRFGGRDVRTLDTQPGNVRSVTGENLPGLDSSYAAIPSRAAGPELTSEDFIATAGQRNLASSLRLATLAPDISRASLIASGELTFAPGLTGFADLLWTHRKIDYQIGASALSGVVVPASNAFNPFDVPVVVNRSLEELPLRHTISEGQLTRVVVGVRRNWSEWSAEAWIGDTRDHVDQRTENELDNARTLQALASPDPLTALNPFRDGASGSPELLRSLIAAPRMQTYAMSGLQVYANAHGPIATLPAGEVSLMIGSEWRREEWRNAFLTASPARSAAAFFFEARAPLVRSSMDIPALDSLSVSLGMRGDDYTELGSRVTPQYGVSWSPLPAIRVRGSYSDLHRVPSVQNYHGQRLFVPLTYPDPRRGGELSNLTAIGGGNAALQMSTGRSWTLGFDFSAPAQSNLRFSAAYWRTSLDGYITPVPIPIILSNEQIFSDRIVRAEPTAQDLEAGVPGKLLSLDLGPRNSGKLHASGVDANLSFAWDSKFGSFASALSACWYLHYGFSISPDLPMEERVGIASEFGTIPQWRASASLGWNRGALSVATVASIVAPYDDARVGVRNDRSVDEQVLLDIQAALRLDAFAPESRIFHSIKLTAGIANLLDGQQDYAALGSAGFDPSQTMLLRQRFWYVRLGKAF